MLTFSVESTPYDCMLELWRRQSEKYNFSADVSLAEMANKFNFTPGQLKGAVSTAYYFAQAQGENEISSASLKHFCCRTAALEISAKKRICFGLLSGRRTKEQIRFA